MESLLSIELVPAIGLLISGILIATIVMAIGIGGGILWAPLLILVYDLSPAEAVATSLAIQTLGLGSGSFAFIKSRLVIPQITIKFYLVAVPGVILGSLMSINLAQNDVKLAIGIMAMMIAILFVSGRDKKPPEATDSHIDNKVLMKLLPLPAGLGFIMGMISTGISEWLIPLLRQHLHIPMHQAIGSMVAMMFMLALTATITYALLSNNILWHYCLLGGAGTLLGAQFGVLIGKRIQEKLLKQSFIYLMTLVGIHLIFQSI